MNDKPTVTLPRLLTTQQAAEYLGVKPQTLRGWRMRGRGPRSVKYEGAVRYAATDLLAWIEKQENQS